MIIWIFGLIVLVLIFFVAMRVHRKGDFAFRIRKLQKRTATLVSRIMEYESEADYLALIDNPQTQTTIKEIEQSVREANEVTVAVSDHLTALQKRASSWFDFSDLYVEIGLQEESLEQAEANFQRAWAKFKELSDI